MKSSTISYPEPILIPTPSGEVAVKLYGRYDTLTKTLEYLPDNAVIIEIGTSHNPSGKLTDGWSSLAFGQHIKERGGQLIIIDNDHEAMQFCKELMDKHRFGDVAWYIEADVFAFFEDITLWKECGLDVPDKVDLMYFDAWDRKYIDPETGDEHEGHAKYVDLWLEVQLRFPRIEYVLLDDTHRPGKNFNGISNHEIGGSEGISGKGEHLLPTIVPKDYTIEFFELGQVLLKKNDDKTCGRVDG